MDNLLVQYFNKFGTNKETIYSLIENRLNCTAYQLLNNKTIDEIKKYGKEDFIKIFNNLYCPQRQSMYNDLIIILNNSSGLSFFKGFVRKLINSKHPDIEQVYRDTRNDIDYYSKEIGKKLKFGRGTISQIAHFCKPDKYPIYNTKSKEIINHIYKSSIIEENIIDFTNYANKVVVKMNDILESKFNDEEFTNYVHTYRYVLLDDFVEFAYHKIKS
ncbi:MAG: hypothetical protein ABRQ27_12740 [Clostridiaceae bacterium]